jgi:hypothetical protein
MRSPKKHYLEGKKLLPEPVYGNEKANQEILKNLKKKQKIQKNNYNKNLKHVDLEIKDIPNKLNTTEAAIPSFVTNKVNFKNNHTCSKLNRINCDNSLNFISHCSRSIYSNCNLNEILVDCRKLTSKRFYENNIEKEELNFSVFGEDAKCVKVKSNKKMKSAICANIKCDISKKFYYIFIPESFCKKFC